jgi:MFS family permease
MPPRSPAPHPPPRPALILAVVAFGVFVAADDLTVVSTMLRQIVFDLGIPLPEGLDQAAWIVNAYLIAHVAVMPFAGRLSDLVGRRPVYIGALLIFLVGSIWVPLADSFAGFLVGRVLTAVGGGAMVPVALAVVGDVYAREKRAGAMGTLGAIDTAGWVWGPLYGALLIRFLTWRWQFYLNIPLALFGLIAAWYALAHLPKPAQKGRIDWWGAATLSLSLLSLNIALLNSGDVQSAGGFISLDQPASPTWPYYLLAALSFALFLFLQTRLSREPYSVNREPNTEHGTRITEHGTRITEHGTRITEHGTRITEHGSRSSYTAPLLDLTLFRRQNFSPAVLVNFLVGSVLIIAMVNVPLVINVLEIETAQAAIVSGLLLSMMTVSMAIMAFVGGRLTERWSYRPVTLLGLGLCALGFGLMGSSWEATAVGVHTPYSQMAWQLALLGMGFGLVIAPVGTAVINAAPDDQRGIAASLVILLRLMGMSVGLSGLTAWGLRRFEALRGQIELPDLPLSDPAYQQAIFDGLTQTTVMVLTETFLLSALVAGLAMLVSLRLKREEEGETAVV